jgi:hypothetical protein
MMENESLREPKNTTVMMLLVLTAVLAIWAIWASVTATNRRKDFDRVTAEKETLRVECDQIKQDSALKMNEAEKLRQTAMEWTRQHQLQVQEDMRKKADEAAKLAKAKEESLKKTATPVKGKVTPVKKSSTKAVPVKKTSRTTVHKLHA